ncbi:MAG: arginine-tRNA-protein transferase [Candidatus Adlerbacteria bacterium]|nr:arginine-tRNA-protein transferase [Candidatus Adlerbacteria bacterium]
MRTAAAPTPDFDSYIDRPETRYIERDEENLEELYEQGYLPYSSTRGLQGIFYSTRSARVALPEFSPNSENRRIAKKFDGQFQKRRIPLSDFDADEGFYAFMTAYFAQRHGPNVAPRARIELWMQPGVVSTIVEYRQGMKVVGYALEAQSGRMRHYWFSAYDLSLAQQSLGLWMMLDCIRDAAAAGFEHYYLGTVYDTKALYKTNFAPLEWHDGLAWSRDLQLLKEKGRTD